MRALVVGAVEGTRVAINAIASCPGWTVAGIMTLPPDLSSRHSDFVDLTQDASRVGAKLIHAANSNSEEACREASSVEPSCTFIIGWSQICRPAFRAAVGDKVVGYHPAALPRLRGRAAIPWTILLDEKITASTLFWIDDGVDTGDILAQRFFHIAPRETAASLYAKHMAALGDILDHSLRELADGKVPRFRQDDACATYATKRTPEDGRIDWKRPAYEVDRLIRAVGRPYPGAFTEYRGARMTIWNTRPADGEYHGIEGQVVARGDTWFEVICGDGKLLRVTDYDQSDSAALPAMHAVLGRA
jgi:methionyl-tRNA formyltransferase